MLLCRQMLVGTATKVDTVNAALLTRLTADGEIVAMSRVDASGAAGRAASFAPPAVRPHQRGAVAERTRHRPFPSRTGGGAAMALVCSGIPGVASGMSLPGGHAAAVRECGAGWLVR